MIFDNYIFDDFGDLVNNIEDIISVDYKDLDLSDEQKCFQINQKIKDILKGYNAEHFDNYDIKYTTNQKLDIIPINYEAFKVLNEYSDNILSLLGYVWSFDKNAICYGPSKLNDKEKIKFLISAIIQLKPETKGLFEQEWTDYINYERNKDEDEIRICW